MNPHPPLRENPAFLVDFERLRGVSLNPARHTTGDAQTHALAVAARAAALASVNGRTQAEAAMLSELGLVHDIGKIEGTTAAAKSVELLPRYQITDPAFTDLVRYHDVNLPWHISLGKGQPATDKAWRKLASRVDVHLLCLFMIADRVDCPGGWRANAPLVWFLEEAARRGHRGVALADAPSDQASGNTR